MSKGLDRDLDLRFVGLVWVLTVCKTELSAGGLLQAKQLFPPKLLQPIKYLSVKPFFFSTLSMLGNFPDFLWSSDIFVTIDFFIKTYFGNTVRVSNSSDPDHARRLNEAFLLNTQNI